MPEGRLCLRLCLRTGSGNAAGYVTPIVVSLADMDVGTATLLVRAFKGNSWEAPECSE